MRLTRPEASPETHVKDRTSFYQHIHQQHRHILPLLPRHRRWQRPVRPSPPPFGPEVMIVGPRFPGEMERSQPSPTSPQPSKPQNPKQITSKSRTSSFSSEGSIRSSNFRNNNARAPRPRAEHPRRRSPLNQSLGRTPARFPPSGAPGGRPVLAFLVRSRAHAITGRDSELRRMDYAI